MKNLNTPFIIWIVILGKTSEKCQLTMNTLKSDQQSRRSKKSPETHLIFRKCISIVANWFVGFQQHSTIRNISYLRISVGCLLILQGHIQTLIYILQFDKFVYVYLLVDFKISCNF